MRAASRTGSIFILTPLPRKHRVFKAKSLGSGARPPFSSYVTLGKSLNYSVPPFYHL